MCRSSNISRNHYSDIMKTFKAAFVFMFELTLDSPPSPKPTLAPTLLFVVYRDHSHLPNSHHIAQRRFVNPQRFQSLDASTVQPLSPSKLGSGQAASLLFSWKRDSPNPPASERAVLRTQGIRATRSFVKAQRRQRLTNVIQGNEAELTLPRPLN